MAVYHFKVQHISRGSGRSATAAAAYRASAVIQDERTGEIHDYTRKQGVLSSEILAPSRAPEWARDRESLWNMAEATEKRKDARVARENVVALPHELSFEDNKKWLHEFVEDAYVKRGMVAQVDIHGPNREGDQRNIHAHILLSVRPVTRNGFQDNKPRVWNEKETLIKWREQYADHMNRALEKAKLQERVDHRSYEDQGVNKLPTNHLGPAASSMERRGNRQTRIGNENRLAKDFNDKLAADQRSLRDIQAKIDQEEKRQRLAQDLDKKATAAEAVERKKEEEHKVELPSPIDPNVIEKDRSWWREKSKRRDELEETLEGAYDRQSVEAELKAARLAAENSKGMFSALAGKKEAAEQRVAELTANLENIAQREQEMRGKLNNELSDKFKQRFPDRELDKDLQSHSLDEPEHGPTSDPPQTHQDEFNHGGVTSGRQKDVPSQEGQIEPSEGIYDAALESQANSPPPSPEIRPEFERSVNADDQKSPNTESDIDDAPDDIHPDHRSRIEAIKAREASRFEKLGRDPDQGRIVLDDEFSASSDPEPSDAYSADGIDADTLARLEAMREREASRSEGQDLGNDNGLER